MNEVHEIDSERLNATIIGLAIRLAFLGVILFLSLSIIRPFFETAAWSVVSAVVIYPVFDLVARWLGGRRRLAAALITILILVIVFGPATWRPGFGRSPASHTRTPRDRSVIRSPPVETVKNWPVIGEPLFQFWDLASTNLSAALVKLARHLKPLGGTLLGAAGSVGTAILQFFASIIIAGFLLSPGPTLVEAVAVFLHRRVSRRGTEFTQLAGATIRNVSQGVIGVSLLQALLAGIGLMAVGVPAARIRRSHPGDLFGLVRR